MTLSLLWIPEAYALRGCEWVGHRLSTPARAPRDLVNRAISVSLRQRDLFMTLATRVQRVKVAIPSSAQPSTSGSALGWEAQWVWPHRLDLTELSLNRSLHQANSTVSLDEDLYALCVISPESVSHREKREPLELWSTHPFELSASWRVGRHPMVQSLGSAQLMEAAERVHSVKTQPPLIYRLRLGSPHSSGSAPPQYWLLRFKPRRGQVRWSLTRSRSSVNKSRVESRTPERGPSSSGRDGRDHAEASALLPIPKQRGTRRSRSDLDRASQRSKVLPRLLKPLEPLPSPSRLVQVLKTPQPALKISEPQIIQLTARVSEEPSSSNGDRRPARVHRVDVLCYLPHPPRTSKQMIEMRESVARGSVKRSRAQREEAWRLEGRRSLSLEEYHVTFNTRRLATASGDWLLISARLKWRRPIWTESWEVYGTLLPAQLRQDTSLRDAGRWEARGWVQVSAAQTDRVRELRSTRESAWVSALSPYISSHTSPSGVVGKRGTLNWSVFKSWGEVLDLYNRGAQMSIVRSEDYSLIDQLIPDQLSAEWIKLTTDHSLTSTSPLHLNLPVDQPLEVIWRLPYLPDELSELTALPNPSSSDSSMQQAQVSAIQASLLPDSLLIAAPLAYSTSLDPHRYARLRAIDARGELILWSPPYTSSPRTPARQQPRALRYWGVVKRGTLEPSIPRSLNGQPLPAQSVWVRLGESTRGEEELTAHVVKQGLRELELRYQITAPSTARDHLRAALIISPPEPADLLGGAHAESPLAIPDQLTVYGGSRWWSGLKSAEPQSLLDSWRRWIKRRTTRRGALDVMPQMMIRPAQPALRKDLSSARAPTHLEGWWTMPRAQVWIPSLANVIYMSPPLKVQRIVIAPPDVLRPCLSESRGHLRGAGWSYRSDWGPEERGGEEVLVWKTTLSVSSPLQASPKTSTRASSLSDREALIQAESSLCFGPHLRGERQRSPSR